MGILDLLLNIAKHVAESIGWLKEKSQSERDRLADFFDKIAESLESISSDLRKGESPHGKCRELQIYLEDFAEVAGTLLGGEEVAKLEKYLDFAQHSPTGYSAVSYDLIPGWSSVQEGRKRAPEIDRIAGQFRGTANLLRVNFKKTRKRKKGDA